MCSMHLYFINVSVWKQLQYFISTRVQFAYLYGNKYYMAFLALFNDLYSFQVESTDERIDMEQLKVKEKIYFYEDIILFEDELADNGISKLNVKMVKTKCLV